jgi:hypothetical protein
MTQISGPGNQLCPPDPTPETIVVSPELKSAMSQVAAEFPNLVVLAPTWTAESCSDFQGGGPHLTLAGDGKRASEIADNFTHPQ